MAGQAVVAATRPAQEIVRSGVPQPARLVVVAALLRSPPPVAVFRYSSVRRVERVVGDEPADSAPMGVVRWRELLAALDADEHPV